MNKKFKTSIATAYALLLLTACGQAPSVVQPSANTGSTNSAVTSTVDVQSIGQLKFSKVSDEKSAQYNGMINQTASSNASRDSAAPVAPTATVGAMGGAVAADAKIAPSMMYFPNPGAFEEYAVIDFEEAKTAGFTGTYLEALNKIVKPIILALGSDARLVNSYGSTDANGKNTSVTPSPAPSSADIAYPYYYYNPYQWQFTYASASKKEVYNISISSQETLVLKQTWGLKDLNPTDLRVDSKQAIDIVTKAVLDKNYSSPDGNANQYLPPEAQTLYEIPKDSNWYLYLEKEKGNLIWNINLNINYNYGVVMPMAKDDTVSNAGGGTSAVAPSSMPVVPEYWYSGGYARINAATGEIITLSRPTRYKNVVQPYPVSVGTNVADAVTAAAEPPCCKE